ncbi:MAG TPA: cation:proton antiporter [Bryobacteraceae bacterium]|nr:cation:proton antiporter [Bryobacteraceae bacterium]
MNSASHDISLVFMELGAAIVGLAILARLASRWGFSAIPLYLIAGLAFGNGGLAPLNVSKEFIHIGAEIGVLLLLFMLGLEYTGDDLKRNLRLGLPAGIADFALNFPPGLLAGLWLGWKPLTASLLGGVTYISSSGIIAKVLGELQRLGAPETPTILSVLVLEDLAMAVYLPLTAALLLGGTSRQIATAVSIAIGTAFLVLLIAVRFGDRLSRLAAHESDEIILLTIFGAVLLVAGVAQRLQVSAAIGAFLVGIATSGSIAERSHRLLAPLRDLFAAIFFFFFGLQVDPATLPKALPMAVALGAITTITKIVTGYWAASRAHIDRRGRWRVGAALVARGEFSIVIAGLGTILEPSLGTLAAAYVLILAVLGPSLARAVK